MHLESSTLLHVKAEQEEEEEEEEEEGEEHDYGSDEKEEEMMLETAPVKTVGELKRPDLKGSESLRTHMFKQHHISRMYMCRCCNWAFPDKSLLHIHLQSINNNNESVPHAVINRSCHVITDPFQLIRSPLLTLTSPPTTIVDPIPLPIAANFPIPTSVLAPLATDPPTFSHLAGLPKPIPITTPIYLPEKKESEEKTETYTSQSPTCSSASFKSDLSAFHLLTCSERALIGSPVDTASPSGSSASSRISPRHDCFDCHVSKTKLTIAENKCKYLESRVSTQQQEAFETHAQMNGLEQTVLRLRMEAHVLREHNDLFQRKLLECQNLAVKYLQNEKSCEPLQLNAFLRTLINNTILGHAP
ncbi:unnamed protein product [Caenorhabditis sp. 36 PRJEB53466]|nr:unnamed protein product [Caenorhabditis sp. 36 PRJEB53466]